jgi:DNA-directed RNA polymerase specialized sigma24 family protein
MHVGWRDRTEQGTSIDSLFAALDRLPPRQQAAILRYYHDYDYASIAQILARRDECGRDAQSYA